ncbi:hypothetical protein BJX61DRAFT_550535 [Aspergillus egyptiacus]|nr:hypothetical protein BJX61DRAFT_550535 [Aspergillus egyptiacus]
MSATMNNWKVGKSTRKSSKSGARLPQIRKAVPRQDSPNVDDPRNRTSSHPGQADWSWMNLPDILYQLRPTVKPKRAEEPPLMPYLIHGRRLRSFEILPDNISSAVGEFRVETWMRLDPRITLKDITDRMHPSFRITENALQQRNVRFRQAFAMIAWGSGNKRSLQLEENLIKKMKALGLDVNSNSTRGVTPGLICPELGEAGGRVPLPPGWGAKKLGIRSRPQRLQLTFTTEPNVLSKKLQEVAGELAALPQEPKVSSPDVTMSDFVHEVVPYDETHTHADGALPIVQGPIPDDELPKTVCMADLDLRLGARQPQRQVKPDHKSLPLRSDTDCASAREHTWIPKSVTSHQGFCLSDCLDGFPHTPGQTPTHTHSFGITPPPSEPPTPTTGLFELDTPLLLDDFPGQEKNVFDMMFDKYLMGACYVSDMPIWNIQGEEEEL